MARPNRTKLKFDEASVNTLLMEIYNESFNLKAKTSRLYTNWESRIKENGEIAAFGDQIIKIIAAEHKNQDQKIVLLRYLKEVVFDKIAVSKNDAKDVESVNSDGRNNILSMVAKELEKKELERTKLKNQ